MRWIISLLLLLPSVASAGTAPVAPRAPSASAFCEAAISVAERELHLPPHVLFAIAEVESGRPDAACVVRPWPWTINAEVRGQMFASKAEAIATVRALQLQGVRSIDVGCMQVNLMHHPNAFVSLDEAFEPTTNAAYAARFLNALYSGSNSWLQAVAAYHSSTPAIGADYERRVMARLQMPGFGVGRGLVGLAPVQAAYRDFAPASHVYGAFSATDRVYGAFAAAPAFPAPHRVAQR